MSKVLYVVVCAAGPAVEAGRLRDEGVRVLLGPGEFEPPSAGADRIDDFPWERALDALAEMASPG